MAIILPAFFLKEIKLLLCVLVQKLSFGGDILRSFLPYDAEKVLETPAASAGVSPHTNQSFLHQCVRMQ